MMFGMKNKQENQMFFNHPHLADFFIEHVDDGFGFISCYLARNWWIMMLDIEIRMNFGYGELGHN